MKKDEEDSTEGLKIRLISAEEETKKYRALYRREADTTKFLKSLLANTTASAGNTGEVRVEKLKETAENFVYSANDNKISTNKLGRVLSSILTILATLGSGYSINLLTSSPPILLGYSVLGLSVAVLIIATILNIFVLGGENDAQD